MHSSRMLLLLLLPLVSGLREECSSWTYRTLHSPHRHVGTPQDSHPCGDRSSGTWHLNLGTYHLAPGT